MDITLHLNGKNYLITPRLRYVKKDDELILEQCYLEQNVIDQKQLKEVWFKVPTIEKPEVKDEIQI